MKFLSKRNVSVLSLIVGIFALISVEELRFCEYILGYRTGCLLPVGGIYELLIFALTVLLLPVIILVLPLKPIVFEAWKRFAVWAVPIVLVLVLLIENGGSGGGLPGQLPPGYLFYPLFGLIYFTTSFVIIARAWWKSRRGV